MAIRNLDDVSTAFKRYFDIVVARFNPGVDRRNSQLRIDARVVHTTVRDLEAGVEFEQLVYVTSLVFSTDKKGEALDQRTLEYIVATESFKNAIENFFRRSGFYGRCIRGDVVDADLVWPTYLQAFIKETAEVRYLAAVDSVDFYHSMVNLEGFSIRKYSADELGILLNNDVNAIFYPDAVLDVQELENYWFIETSEAIARDLRVWWDTTIELDFSPSFEREFTVRPRVIEAAVQQLALCNWEEWSGYSPRYLLNVGAGPVIHIQKRPQNQNAQKHRWEPGKGWYGFVIPFVLEISDDLLSQPGRAPSITGIARHSFFSDETGEEVGEAVVYAIEMSSDESVAFEAFVRRIGRIVRRLKRYSKEWPFVDVALALFVKAFFSDGLQQLLSHITVLEALFGEVKETSGVRALLSRRIPAVLATTDEQRKYVRKAFDELYDFRSNLVHGKRGLIKQEVYVGHLREARSMARRSLIWFLHYLEHVMDGLAPGDEGEGLPTREEILAVLDLGRESRSRVRGLIENLPSSFPQIPEWFEDSNVCDKRLARQSGPKE